MKLDKVDKEILSLLQHDGRLPASHIAEKLSISIPTVTERIKKLQDTNIIDGIHASIDPKKLGLDVSALITVISESSLKYKDFTGIVEETSEIVQCFSTTGRGSHTLLVITKNSQSLEHLLRNIQSWPGVARTETQIILSSFKSIHSIPIPKKINIKKEL